MYSDSVCVRKDRRCCTRVTPARSPWRAHVACIPHLQQRKSFSRTLLKWTPTRYSPKPQHKRTSTRPRVRPQTSQLNRLKLDRTVRSRLTWCPQSHADFRGQTHSTVRSRTPSYEYKSSSVRSTALPAQADQMTAATYSSDVSIWHGLKACAKRTGAAVSVACRRRERLALAGQGMQASRSEVRAASEAFERSHTPKRICRKHKVSAVLRARTPIRYKLSFPVFPL